MTHISELCHTISSQPFGTHFKIQEDDTHVEIQPIQQDPIEKITRVIESFVQKTLAQVWRPIPLFWSKIKTTKDASQLSSIEHLSTIFGKNRIEKIAESLNIKGDSLLSKEEYQSIFSRLLLLNENDFQDLLDEIIEKKPLRKSLTTDATTLHDEFQGITSLEDCNNEQLLKLEKLLLPFQTEEEAFLGYSPFKQITPEIVLSPEHNKRFELFWINHLRYTQTTPANWEYYAAKRLTLCDLPIGSIIRSPNGLLIFKKIIQGKGACKMVFEPLGKNSNLPAYIFYKGTSVNFISDRFHAYESLLEDMRPNIGAKGVIATFEETQSTLKSLSEKFSNIKGVGFSLGGAHVQRDAILFPQFFTSIVTVGSPRIDEKSARLFNEHIKQPTAVCKEIIHNVDIGDVVPAAGECLLGESSEKKLETIIRVISNSKKNPDIHQLETILKRSALEYIQNTISTILSHITTPILTEQESPYHVSEYSSRDKDAKIAQLVSNFIKGVGLHADVESIRSVAHAIPTALDPADFYDFASKKL